MAPYDEILLCAALAYVIGAVVAILIEDAFEMRMTGVGWAIEWEHS